MEDGLDTSSRSRGTGRDPRARGVGVSMQSAGIGGYGYALSIVTGVFHSNVVDRRVFGLGMVTST